MSDRAMSKQLLGRLQRHYIKPGPFPGGVFVPECGINGGAQTRADALYVGFTSTSGRILVGHELKVSRADWRKELDSAGKADFWADNCHAWYIVTLSTAIVPPEELPHGWGLMVPNARSKTRMDVKVKAAVHADRVPSWEATRSILARLDTLRHGHDEEVKRDALEKARKQAEAEQERRTEGTLTRKQSDRLATLDRLEEALGVEVDPAAWADEEKVRPEHVAAAIKLVRLGEGLAGHDRHSGNALRRAAEALLAGLDEYTAARQALLDLARAAS